MKLKWTDVYALGEILYERFPEKPPLEVRFTDLMAWVMEIPEFEDSPERCGERVLEAIQMVWLSEWQEDR